MKDKRMIKMMIEHAKEAKASCRLNRIANPKNTEARAEELLSEVTIKVIVAGSLEKDLSPLFSILEQARDIVSDILGDDNFDI